MHVTVRRGWVRRPALDAAFDTRWRRRYRANDEGYERLAFPLWHACSVEMFTRYVLEESNG